MTWLDLQQLEAYTRQTGLDVNSLMRKALQEAARAAELGEVPVGATVADAKGSMLAAAGNRSITRSDPSAHAEILALRRAGAQRGNYRLPGSLLITTLEPCIMCLGCLVQARCAGLIFACPDPKAGAVVSRLQLEQDLGWLNHSFWHAQGLAQEESSALLRDFFRNKRHT